MLTYFVSLCLITASLSLIIGLFTYIRGKEKSLSKIFSLFSFSIFVWSLGLGIEVISPSQELSFLWSRFLHMGVAFLTPAYLHIALILVNLDKKRKPILIVAYIWGFILCCCNFSNLLVKSVSPKFYFNYYTDPGILYPFLLIQFFICSGYGFYVLFRSLKWIGGYKRNQIKYFLVGSVLGYIGGTPTYLPVFDIFVHPATMLLLPVYYTILAYAIVKHRLMDIDIVIKKTVTYSLLLLMLLVPCYLLIMLEQKIFFDAVNPLFSISILCLLILIAFEFPKIKIKTEDTVERILFKNKYDYQQVLSRFGESMVSILELDDLLKDIINTVVKTMELDKASILLIDEEKNGYSIQASYGLSEDKVQDIQISKNDNFIKWLQAKREIIIREELEMVSVNQSLDDVIEKMRWMMSEVCIPLISKGKLIGVLNLGHKRDGKMYTQDDLDLFSVLANQSAISILVGAELLLRGKNKNDKNYKTLNVIAQESEKMKEILKKMGSINKYRTKHYVGDVRIIDIDKATRKYN